MDPKAFDPHRSFIAANGLEYACMADWLEGKPMDHKRNRSVAATWEQGVARSAWPERITSHNRYFNRELEPYAAAQDFRCTYRYGDVVNTTVTGRPV